VLVAVAYFLNYELFHFAFHCSEKSWVMKLPGFKKVMALHKNHHKPELMSKYNFNITYPIGDLLFGTYYRESNQTNKGD
jgi:sterol desaturase/sphingolipid hydroxylase (fatty acid hydroxylase superfamily)